MPVQIRKAIKKFLTFFKIYVRSKRKDEEFFYIIVIIPKLDL